MAIDRKTSFVHAPSVAFRAHRNYLHSTTLYEELMMGAQLGGLTVDGPIDLTTRRFLTVQPEFQYCLGLSELPDNPPAVFSFHADSLRWHGTIVGRDDAVVDRRPYDETPIRQGAVLEGKSIWIDQETGVRPIEAVTALNLLLHQNLFSIAEGRHWYFARLHLKRPLRPDDARMVRLELIRNFASKMTRTAIRMRDGPIGYLEFILGDTV